MNIIFGIYKKKIWIKRYLICICYDCDYAAFAETDYKVLDNIVECINKIEIIILSVWSPQDVKKFI